jgi:hypothetical protein
MGCTSGDGSCLVAEFLFAEESDFFPAELKEATERIREAIANVPDPGDGRRLSILNTPFGVVLAWVEHDVQPTEPPVTFASDPAEIIEALGLIGVKPSDAKGSQEAV